MITNPNSRKKALRIICQNWLEGYGLLDSHNSSTIVDQIFATYEIIVEDFREILNSGHLADIFKVVSGTQLSVIWKQPIRTNSPIESEKLNVLLSIFIAQSFLSRYFNIDLHNTTYLPNPVVSNLVRKQSEFLLRTHQKQTIELPVISNALYWEAYIELFLLTQGLKKE